MPFVCRNARCARMSNPPTGTCSGPTQSLQRAPRRAGCRRAAAMSEKADAALTAEIARTERALQDALNDLRVRVSLGQRDRESRKLIARCRELGRVLTRACDRLGDSDDENATRAAAHYLAAHLVILEREVEQAPLH